jgi:hypothetical protein
MQQLWFNQNGILHDGIGLLLCSYCPCDVPPSGSSSSGSSGSGSGSGSQSESDSGVVTECCPDNPVPLNLTVTFTGGSCAGTYTMNWFADTSEWISEDAPITLRMTCEEFGWYLSSDGFAESPVSVTCSPFELVFSIFSDPFCGTFTITITG